MDSDFEEKCQSIAKRRKDRKVSVTKYLPPYINTPDAPNMLDTTSKQSDSGNVINTSTSTVSKVSPCRKRKISNWQRGFLSSRKKRKRERPVLCETIAGDQVILFIFNIYYCIVFPTDYQS